MSHPGLLCATCVCKEELLHECFNHGEATQNGRHHYDDKHEYLLNFKLQTFLLDSEACILVISTVLRCFMIFTMLLR